MPPSPATPDSDPPSHAVNPAVGAIAQDLHHFLHPILALADALLEDREPGPDRRRALELLRASVARSLALVDQLLRLSQAEAAKPESQDLNLLLRELEPILSHALPGSISLALELDPGLPPLLVDGLQIQRIIFNLVKNVRNATAQAGRITLRTAQMRLEPDEARTWGIAPGPFACLEIQDEGTGEGSGPGAGPGLSMVESAVRAQQGVVRWLREPGRSSRFQVLLPLGEDFG